MASVRARAGLIGAIMLSGLISGCSGAEQTPQEAMEQFTAEQIFERGEFELASRDPEKAEDLFAEVERLYRYSELAKRALIMQAFSFNQHTDYESSRAAAQRYIDFYPADEDAAYAQYLLALSYYD